MTDKPCPHLILYLDQGTRLRLFADIGTLGREMAPYRKLSEAGYPVTVLSWAKGEDAAVAAELAPIRVIQNTSRLPNRLWMLIRLLRLRADFGPHAVLMTNQLHGAYLPAFARFVNRVDLVLRFGYLLSLNVSEESGGRSWRTRLARINEAVSAWAATSIIVTTESIRDVLAARFPFVSEKLSVVPNFVGDAFMRLGAERTHERREGRSLAVVYTGRLAPSKRVDLIIRGLARRRGDRLFIVGDGPERPRLAALAAEHRISAEFCGILPHEALPELYRRCDVFVTMTEYEGHPKALIEAMASGLAVVATAVRGVEDVVVDGGTGVLVEPTPEAMAAALDRLAADAELRRSLGSAAAVGAAASYGLDGYVRAIETVVHSHRGRFGGRRLANG